MATSDPMKAKLKRIVALLPRLAPRSDRVAEHDPALDYDYEHEHEWLSRQLAVGPDIY